MPRPTPRSRVFAGRVRKGFHAGHRLAGAVGRFLLSTSTTLDGKVARRVREARVTIHDLPPELVIELSTHLSPLAIVRLSRADRHFHALVSAQGAHIARAIAKRETSRLWDEYNYLEFKDVPLDVAMRRYEARYGRPWDYGGRYSRWNAPEAFCRADIRMNPGMWVGSQVRGRRHVGLAAAVMMEVSHLMDWYVLLFRRRLGLDGAVPRILADADCV